MNDLCYCLYAFTRPECCVAEIGPGVDPRYRVELVLCQPWFDGLGATTNLRSVPSLPSSAGNTVGQANRGTHHSLIDRALVCEGPIAALTSRVGLDQFAPERLQGKTAEDIQWLGKIAARHNEIICLAAATSSVLPLRLGAVFRSLDSLQATLARCRPTVAEFLNRLGDRQEWGVKLYLAKHRVEPAAAHSGPPQPHYPSGMTPSLDQKAILTSAPRNQNIPSARSGTAYLTQRKAQLDCRRSERADSFQTIQNLERRLECTAEQSCRIRNMPSDLTGRAEEMVYNAAFLLSSSEQANWLEAIQGMKHNFQSKGLVLEISGPWPPYHFCPSLEL
jgi:hypothetical protein